MPFNKVIAIVQLSSLEKVEESLRAVHAPGITVTKVKGFGEYKNFFSPNLESNYVRLEVFTTRAEEIANVIMDAAHSGAAGDGIVAIMPVHKLYRIRHRREVNSDG